ncbi:hypothetical protein KFE98_11330 [bacterium SCSIO 12741]|nr:hypothetical protein KFE98_11330 [bacterium SCSIO 12741]
MSDIKYRTNSDMRFTYASTVVEFDINSLIDNSNYEIDSQGKTFDSAVDKLVIDDIDKTVDQIGFTVRSTSDTSSQGVVKWFKEETGYKKAISQGGGEWPKEMRFALKPTVYIVAMDKDTKYRFEWEGLTLGMVQIDKKRKWWLASKYALTLADLRIRDIVILEDMYQEIVLKGTGDIIDKRAHLFITLEGKKTFQVKCVINDIPLSQDWYSKI